MQNFALFSTFSLSYSEHLFTVIAIEAPLSLFFLLLVGVRDENSQDLSIPTPYGQWSNSS